jgi:hypothetical protein
MCYLTIHLTIQLNFINSDYFRVKGIIYKASSDLDGVYIILLSKEQNAILFEQKEESIIIYIVDKVKLHF